jgi:hypothetical protein
MFDKAIKSKGREYCRALLGVFRSAASARLRHSAAKPSDDGQSIEKSKMPQCDRDRERRSQAERCALINIEQHFRMLRNGSEVF